MNVLKLKAGALQFTMFVVVVIALLLAAFVILVHTYKTFKIQTSFAIETINNTDKGIHYILNNKLPLQDSISLNINDEAYKTIKVHRDFWGVFEKATSISKIKHKVFKKIALVGGAQLEKERTALYLEDKNKPLVLVGNTKIKGITYLPKQGVRTGNISGHSYYDSQLIYGQTKTSDKLPKLHSETIKHIKNITKTYKNVDSNQFIKLNKNKTHQNSFYKPIQIIYSLTDIHLSEASLIGHILVQSETKIIVDASSNLKDVILIAPKIEIKNHVKSTFQAFATKEIIVGKQCDLKYPSTLILYETPSVSQKNNKENPSITIDKNSEINGAIIYNGHSKSYKSHLFIGENTTLIGEVYCNQNLELLGKVYGSIYTAGFAANQSGSVYQNHIYNGTINVNNLPEEYIGLPFENSKKNIAKWLY